MHSHETKLTELEPKSGTPLALVLQYYFHSSTQVHMQHSTNQSRYIASHRPFLAQLCWTTHTDWCHCYQFRATMQCPCDSLHRKTNTISLFRLLMTAKAGKNYYYYYNHFTTLCSGLPRWVGTRRINHSEFCWSRDDAVAVASAETYASYLHFIPEDNCASTSSLRFLRTGCPSWQPTNSVKALKAEALKASW